MMKQLMYLIKQALLQAQMGCDVIAPSDMMDGSIGKIRKALDKKNIKMFKSFHMLLNMHQIFMDRFVMLLVQKNL